MRHWVEHPSPSTWFPSSHASCGKLIQPSPHSEITGGSVVTGAALLCELTNVKEDELLCTRTETEDGTDEGIDDADDGRACADRDAAETAPADDVSIAADTPEEAANDSVVEEDDPHATMVHVQLSSHTVPHEACSLSPTSHSSPDDCVTMASPQRTVVHSLVQLGPIPLRPPSSHSSGAFTTPLPQNDPLCP